MNTGQVVIGSYAPGENVTNSNSERAFILVNLGGSNQQIPYYAERAVTVQAGVTYTYALKANQSAGSSVSQSCSGTYAVTLHAGSHCRPSTPVVDGAIRLAFFERCDRWSTALQALGVAKGNRVAYISPNTHAQLASFYAVPQIGAVLVPINFVGGGATWDNAGSVNPRE